MPSRREFSQNCARTLAGIAFTGCSLLKAQPARASHSSVARRQVMLDGARVKTIDVHAHCAVPEAMELMGIKTLNSEDLIMKPERLRLMDAQGIDVEALSINPYWYPAERDLARQIVRLQNEKLAELCAAHPDRFVAFATVALQHPDLAAEQLETGMKQLGLRGASIGGSVNGEELSSRRFDPFWAKAQELGALVFIHPQGVPELQKRFEGSGYLANVIGNPLETTIALSHLIFEGTLDRFPGLKICAAHGGGYLPAYAGRFDHGCLSSPASCTGTPLKKHPSEYLRQLYFDSLVFTAEGLRHLVAECGANQIMIGTDYPYVWTTTAVDHILHGPGLTPAAKKAMLGATAARLLRIPA